MARTKIASGSIEIWLRSQPGPMSSNSPQNVLKKAHEIYSQSCPEPVEYGEFVDHLWGRGVVPEQTGALFYLKLPGQSREHKQIVEATPMEWSGKSCTRHSAETVGE